MTGENKTSRKYKLTLSRLMEAIGADDGRGFCLACGADAYYVEPDAREYLCEECGAPKVYGAEEILFMVRS